MAFFELKIPPGIVRAGTEYQSKGAWYDSHLVRAYEGVAIGPVLGWAVRSKTTVTGSARAIATWRDDSNNRRAAIGTHSKLYVMNAAGTLFDITPAGFTAGRASAVGTTGYGYGVYGAGTYGTARRDTSTYLDATVWDLEFFGQYLNCCSPDDGHLYEWILNTSNPATAISGAPTSCLGLVVTPQRFVMALGAGGNKRKTQWCDQEDNTVWTPSSTNQAGDLDIPVGRLMCGKPVGEQVLILSDVDAHIYNYVGLPYVYGRSRVGDGCGAVSKKCIAVAGTVAEWWSNSGFWVYDGFARPLPCPLWDHLQRTLSASQRSKVSAFHNAKNKEFWWLWPSSSEIDSYVAHNYEYNQWWLGSLARGCGSETGVFVNPLMVGADGYVYDHEYGYTYTGQSQPYIRSGPIELASGDNVAEVLGIIADEKTVGDVTLTFHQRYYPNAGETISSTITLDPSGKTDFMFSARQIELVVTGVASTNWRWGNARLDGVRGGTR